MEYCPICGLALSTKGDESRLCLTCGWFGDVYETVPYQPAQSEITKDLLGALESYREVCRDELRAECRAEIDGDPTPLVATIKDVLDVRASLVQLYLTVVMSCNFD
jgi:hypothetical protein